MLQNLLSKKCTQSSSPALYQLSHIEPIFPDPSAQIDMRYRSSPLLLLAVLVSGIGGCTSTQRADSASRRVVTVLHDPG